MHVGHHSFSADHPEWSASIHDLKAKDPHFAHRMQEFETLDKEICRIEEDDMNTLSDFEIEELKKKRLKLSDAIIADIRSV